jgi:hypothetical protein
VEGARQRYVTVKMSLMKLVKKDRRDTSEQRIFDQLAQ